MISTKEPVLKPVERFMYDKSHFAHQVGNVGSLQTLSLIPVVAGDSVEMNFNTVVRFSPLRRYLYQDAVIDLFCFYVPHRHIYGEDWIDFMKGGYDEGVTLGSHTLGAGVTLHSCGYRTAAAATIPSWASAGYIQIWNRYFRDPSDVAGILPDNHWTTVSASDGTAVYGLHCCHLKEMWNTAILPTLTTADYRLALDGGEVDLYNFSQLQGRLFTEQERDWFDIRYADLMSNAFGSMVNTDADQRPTLVMRSSTWMSGVDIDATDTGSLGSYVGKGFGTANLSFPSKFFPEHGALWLMILVRFPAVHTLENHFLISKAEPTYAMIGGDPSIISRQGPYALNANELFVGSGSVALGNVPYAQWYRTQPHHVHLDYELIAGHPFLTASPTSRNDAIYIERDLYDPIFQTLQLRHWNSQGRVDLKVRSYVPDPRASIFAGTDSHGAS